MDRFRSIILCLVLMVTAAVPAHALMRKDMSLVRGRVVSYDHITRILVVDGTRGEGKVSFDVSGADVTTSTMNGNEVVVIFKIQGNKATIVKAPPKR